MNIKPLKVSALVLLCVGGAVNAATVSAAGNITRIGTGTGGEGLYVTIDALTSSSAPLCSAGVLVMPTSAAQYKETVAIVLAVRAQAAQITVYYDNQNCSAINPGAFNLLAVSY